MEITCERSTILLDDLVFIHNVDIPMDLIFKYEQCVCELYDCSVHDFLGLIKISLNMDSKQEALTILMYKSHPYVCISLILKTIMQYVL